MRLDVDGAAFQLRVDQFQESCFSLILRVFSLFVGASVGTIHDESVYFDNIIERPLEITGVPKSFAAWELYNDLDRPEHVTAAEKRNRLIGDLVRNAYFRHQDILTKREVRIKFGNEEPPCWFRHEDVLHPFAGVEGMHMVAVDVRLNTYRIIPVKAIARDAITEEDGP